MTARSPERPDQADTLATDEFKRNSLDHARSECFGQSAQLDSSGAGDSRCPTHNGGTETKPEESPKASSLAVEAPPINPQWIGIPYYGKLEYTVPAMNNRAFSAGYEFLNGSLLMNDPASSTFHFSDTSRFDDPVPVQYDKHHFGQKYSYDTPKPSAEYERLAALADEHIGEPKDRAQFAAYLSQFHERAFYEKLPPEEESNTYEQISRLLSGTSTAGVTADQLSGLAQQLIRQAAHPVVAYQGRHNTCGAVETWLNASHPASVTKLVADVALTGEYRAPDGTTVKIDTQRTRGDAENGTPSRVRSYASQLFQVTAINLLVKKYPAKSNSKLAESKDTNNGVIQYAEEPAFDRWLYAPNGSNEATEKEKFLGVDLSGIPTIGEIILGRHEQNTLLYGVDSGDNSIGFKSEQELHEALASAKRDGKLPLRIAMDTRMEPLSSDKMDEAAVGFHLVTITDFQDDPAPKLLIHNGWSHQFPDHDRLHPVDLHDIYIASLGPVGGISEIQKDIDSARASGKRDYAKELYLVRLQSLYHDSEPTDEQVRGITKLMAELKEHWNGSVQPHEQESQSKALLVLLRDAKPKTFEVLAKEAVRLELTKSAAVLSDAKKLGVTFPVTSSP